MTRTAAADDRAVLVWALRCMCVWSIVTTGCGLPAGDYFGDVPEVNDRGHLRFCNTGEPEGLDPAMVSSSTALRVVNSLFDGLAVYDGAGLPAPSLATHWEVSSDLRRITFHLHDRGRWSNGRPITAYDVAYHVQRVLHPLTASVNAGLLAPVTNAEAYTANRIRVVLRGHGGLRAGTVVEITAVDDVSIADLRARHQRVPDTNLRRSTQPLYLRDLSAPANRAYARVPAGDDVTVIELSGGPVSPSVADGGSWAYVHWDRGDGVYGWVPALELDQLPNADRRYQVRPVPAAPAPGHEPPEETTVSAVEVVGRDLLMLPDVLGIRVPDAHTFVVETERPAPYLLQLAPTRVLRPTPREAVSRRPRRWTDAAVIVTSGPMELRRWRARDVIELARSPTFWNPREARLDRLTVFALESQAASANYYYTGGCDAVAANHIPSSYLRVLAGEDQAGRSRRDYHVEPYMNVSILIVNAERISNVHLRRALALAIDRNVLPRFLHGGELPSSSYTPGMPARHLADADLRACGLDRTDPVLAMVMLSGALCYVPPPGLGHDELRARDEMALARRELGVRFPARLSYKYSGGSEGQRLLAEYLQAQWSRVLGVEVSLQIQEWKSLLADFKVGDFEISRVAILGQFADPESEFLSVFRSGAPGNRPRWREPRFDAAMDAAQTLSDRQARNAKLREAETILLDDAAVIPLYVYAQHRLVRPYVRGLSANLTDQVSLHRAWLDPQWRESVR